MRQRRQISRDLGNARHGIVGLAVVVVALDREQHLGPDLSETVEDPLRAEVGRARRPDCTKAGGGEHEDDGFGHVRHEGCDPVAFLYACSQQRLRSARNRVVHFGVTHATAHLVLAPEHDPGFVVATPQQVFGKVQPRIREPLRSRHHVAIDQNALAASLGHHTAEIPDGSPELLRFAHRPVVELVRVPDPGIPALVDEVNEARDVGLGNACPGRLPQDAG